MRRLAFCVITLLTASLAGPAAAQPPFVPAPPYYAINPTAPRTPPDSPVQQQILRNYRTRLLQTQRDLLRQNPSGLSRDQLDIRRQLNAFSPGFGPASPASPAAAPAAPPNAAPSP